MAYFFYTALFIFGTAVGSFINVLSLRYKPDNKFFDLKTIGGRSRCDHCQKELRWYELIPLFSFFIQRGKCRACGGRLYLQYPLVEFFTGFIFASVSWYLFNFHFGICAGEDSFWCGGALSYLTLYQTAVLAIWLLIFSFFILLSLIDFRLFIIPDEVNLILIFLGFVLAIFNWVNFDEVRSPFFGSYALIFGLRSNFLASYLAAFIGSLIFGAIIILSRGRAMGWGDVKLAAALGLIFGWPEIISVLSLSFIIGALFSIILITKGERSIKDAVPFGPFLVIGSAITFFFGHQLIEGYFYIFNLV